MNVNRGNMLVHVALLALLCVLSTGCLADPPTPARYELLAKKTLVLVDDPDVALGHPNFANVVATTVAYQLREKTQVKRIVATSELEALRSKEGDAFSKMSIAQVGQALNADQVIYIRVTGADLSRSFENIDPQVAAQVRVIDAITGEMRFPRPDPGAERSPSYPVAAQLKGASSDIGRAQSAIQGNKLAQLLGITVAELFYKHKPRLQLETIENPGPARFD